MLPKSKKLEYINSSKELLKQIKELDSKDKTKLDINDDGSFIQSLKVKQKPKNKAISNKENILKMWDIGERMRKFYGTFRECGVFTQSQINDLNFKKELFCEMMSKVEFTNDKDKKWLEQN